MINIYIAKRGSDESLHDAAYRALDFGLRAEYGTSLFNLKILKSEFGKPYFDNSELHFGISHSRDYGGAAIAVKLEIGFDIQYRTVIRDAVINRYLADTMQNFDTDDPVKAWAIRESYGKYTGGGFLKVDFANPHFIQTFELPDGYITAICTESKQGTAFHII